MLTQLLDVDIGKMWNHIRDKIEDALPEGIRGEVTMANILNLLLSGDMQAWVLSEGEDIKAVVTTLPIMDLPTGRKHFLIYTLWAKGVDEGEWIRGMEVLRRYAKSKGCQHIVAYTVLDVVRKRAMEMFGAKSETFIYMEV